MYGQSLRLAEKASRELATASAVSSPSVAPNLRPSKKRAASEMSGEKEEEKTFPRSLAQRRRARTTPRCSCSSSKNKPKSEPTKEKRSKWAVPDDSDEVVGGEEEPPVVASGRRSATGGRSKGTKSAQLRVGSTGATQRSSSSSEAKEKERTPLAEKEVRLLAKLGRDASARTDRLLICRLKVYGDTATSPSCRLQYIVTFFLEDDEGKDVACAEVEAWRLLEDESWDELLHLDHQAIDPETDTRGECARLLQTLFLPSGLIKPEIHNFLSLSTDQDLMHIESVWIYDAFERQGLLYYVLLAFRGLVCHHRLEREYRFIGMMLLAPGKFEDKERSKCWKGVGRKRVEETLMRAYEKYGRYRVVVKDGLSENYVTTVMGRSTIGLK
ncbi:hypothetical protein CBER1_08724 [Cercospora berteroae]|uniref:Uncharacterized protein n=1 Tax=Cercospora berteroae TaxID=357750 RepID=A0A2S6CAI6_9PEZI|nr:hypothetical protein CBER1_08724 [Cercospora berteroae]